MKTLHIYTTIDATGGAISLGSYWDCSSRSPIETAWEFIGDEQGLHAALDTLRDDRNAEFMHVINRVITGVTVK